MRRGTDSEKIYSGKISWGEGRLPPERSANPLGTHLVISGAGRLQRKRNIKTGASQRTDGIHCIIFMIMQLRPS